MRTKQLYYEDAYQKEFTAKVLDCRASGQEYEVCLDATCFYPEGGGQPCDRGTLNGIPVTDVQEMDGEIWHRIPEALSEGTEVTGILDWERRFDLMQQHSGEHIVSGLIHEKYQYENVGFHLTETVMTIDLSGSLTMPQLREIEQLANARVWANTRTEIWVPTEEERAAIPYRSKKALSGEVRLVRFPGSDCCACCGTHVRQTGEIGLIRLTGCQKHKDGVRVELCCGARALAYDVASAEQNHRISVALSAPELETAEAVAHLQEECGSLRGKLSAEREKILMEKAASFAGAGDTVLFEEEMHPDLLRKYAVAVMEICGGRCAVFAGEDESGYKYCIGEKDGDVRELVKEVNAALDGRGGGKPFFAQGSVSVVRAQIEAFFDQKERAKTADLPPVGVVGVGQIGADMAALLLAYGYPVVMYARSLEKAEKGRDSICRDYEDLIRFGKMSEKRKEQALTGLQLTDRYESLSGCAFIIEAVVERLEVKREVYDRLEAVCPPDTIILSETSGIPADTLAEKMKHPERFMVAHSWNPPLVIPLVEAVRAQATSEETVNRAVAFLESLDREVVVLRKSVPGFIGNRIQHSMFREALSLIENGVATPEEIDRAVYFSFGQR